MHNARRIVVVGSLNFDMVARVSRLPVAGETVAARSFQTSTGGKGANQAVACARLGASVAMIGRVGVDSFGERLRESLAGDGVDVSLTAAVDGPSGLALITVDDEAQNSITIVAGANERLTAGDLARCEDELRGASIVLAQLEVPLETVLALSEMTAAAGVPLMLDPAPAQALPAELLRRVTWLTPNETESRALMGDSGSHRPEAVAGALLQRGCRNVALKLGATGTFLAGADVTSSYVSAFNVEGVDTTAAGDAFNGAFAVALSEGVEPVRAARFACAAAAISVTRPGAASSMATRDEVEDFLKQRAPDQG